MKIKKSKGVISLGIMGIVCLALSIVIFLVFNSAQKETPENIYQSGQVFGKVAYKEGKMVAVEIDDITEPEEVEKGTLQYVAKVANANKGVVLEVNKDSKVAQTIKEWTAEKPLYIAGKMLKFNDESQRRIADVNKSSYLKIETKYLLSTAAVDGDNFWLLIMGGAVGVLSLFLVGAAFKLRGKNSKTYEQIVAMYPELEKTDALNEKAAFTAKYSKMVIYKNHLLILGSISGLQFIDLTRVKWLGISVVPAYRSTNSEINYANLEDELKTITLGRYRKKQDSEFVALAEYLSQHFPNILLGEDNRPEGFKRKGLFSSSSKKTITEFLAEKERKSQHNVEQNETEKVENSEQLQEHDTLDSNDTLSNDDTIDSNDEM